MENIGIIPSEKTFVEWVDSTSTYDIKLTEDEARLLLGYVEGHGCGVCLDETNTIILVDIEDPEDDVVAYGIEELVECVSTWNEEFLQDAEVQGAWRQDVLMDATVIDAILERMDNLE